MGDHTDLVEEVAYIGRSCARLLEPGARLRIEIDAQLVGVVGIVGVRRPNVEAEAPEIDGPRDVREISGHERSRRGPVRRADDRRLEPLGRVVGYALLEERVAARAVREPLHQYRPAADRARDRLGNRQVIADEVELGLAPLREQHLPGLEIRTACPSMSSSIASSAFATVTTLSSVR